MDITPLCRTWQPPPATPRRRRTHNPFTSDKLVSRAFSPATVRAYANDLLRFLRFLAGWDARPADVVATDSFDYLD
jgi:hypothetical protein